MKENIYIVSDFFIDEYAGGAELSTSSLISYCDSECIEVKSRQVTLDMLSNNRKSTWIFTNFSLLNPQLIGYIAENLVNYHIIEYDYKYCDIRMPEACKQHRGECCENKPIGQLIKRFF